MAFDFPSSPAEGQIFTAPSGPTYVFNTPTWRAVGQGQIAIISDTPPASPANGALWYESDSGILFIWYNDGNSSQWVQVGGNQTSQVIEAPIDGKPYARKSAGWDDLTNDLAPMWTNTNSPFGGTAAFGYQKLNSGWLIQWGVSGSGGDLTVTFPTPFPTAVGSISCIPRGVGAATGTMIAAMIDTVNTSSFVLRHRFISTGGAGNPGVASASSYWMAIGN